MFPPKSAVADPTITFFSLIYVPRVVPNFITIRMLDHCDSTVHPPFWTRRISSSRRQHPHCRFSPAMCCDSARRLIVPPRANQKSSFWRAATTCRMNGPTVRPTVPPIADQATHCLPISIIHGIGSPEVLEKAKKGIGLFVSFNSFGPT